MEFLIQGSASKHAVVGFSLTLRAEARQYGIKVSTLCPGYLRTNIQKTTENVSAYLNSESNRKMNAQMKFPTPLKHKIYWWLHRIAPEFMGKTFEQTVGADREPQPGSFKAFEVKDWCGQGERGIVSAGTRAADRPKNRSSTRRKQP